MKFRIVLCCFLLTAFVWNLSSQGADSTNRQRLSPGVYKEGVNGGIYRATNLDVKALWPGELREDVNGLRVQLDYLEDHAHSFIFVGVGSVRFNSLGGYVCAPELKFPKFELRNMNGVLVSFITGKSLESPLPKKISIQDFPRFPNGSLKSNIGFFTNGGPFTIAAIDIKNFYRITNEADFILEVCPGIYEFGTNKTYLNRVDLPCVSMKLHIKP